MSRDVMRSMQRSLAHLAPPPIKGGSHGSPIPTHFRPNPKFVQVKDRLAFWHIAPNDKVKLIRGPADIKGTVGTVATVDRERSRVYLVENQFAAKKRQANQYPGEAFTPEHTPSAIVFLPKAYHVDNLRLQVEDAGESHTVSRIKRSAVTWDRRLRRFHWKRYGLVPKLISPEVLAEDGTVEKPAHSGWLQIAWPREATRETQSAGKLDTTVVNVVTQSFFPSLENLTLHATSPTSKAASAALVPELALPNLDLNGGYFSRAVRTKRFNKNKAEATFLSKAERRAARKDAATGRVGALVGEVELA